VIRNVHEAGAAGTKLVLYVSVFGVRVPDVPHSYTLAVGGLSKRGRYYIKMLCHSPIETEEELGLKSCMCHHLCTYK